ncbi:putative glycoside hydrolase family 1, glycoside hydrolase superfamily [Helianthus anomalus]
MDIGDDAGHTTWFCWNNVFAYWFEPFSNTIEDVKAAERAHDFYEGWFLNPLVNGDCPETMKKTAGSRIPKFTKHESERIKGSYLKTCVFVVEVSSPERRRCRNNSRSRFKVAGN